MYISLSIIRIICASLWIGAVLLTMHLAHNEGKYSEDLTKFLNILTPHFSLSRFLNILVLVMAAVGFIAGSAFGVFSEE